MRSFIPSEVVRRENFNLLNLSLGAKKEGGGAHTEASSLCTMCDHDCKFYW